jgi:hypothetical protein
MRYPINSWMSESLFTKLGICIVALEPIAKAYFINKSSPISHCVCYALLNFARQRLGKNITAEINMHATAEELFDASFSVGRVSHQRKAGD